MTTQALAQRTELKTSLLARSAELKETLPTHIAPQKFVNVAMLAYSGSAPVQRACLTPAGRQSFFASVMKCAQDGLLPDGREAALVPYKNSVQYMPMVAGLQKAMRNSGQIASISAHVVFANDHFRYVKGDDERIEHEPAGLDRDPGNPVGAYCIIRLLNGEKVREVMRLSELQKVRAMSKAGDGPWANWWEEMAKKSVIRRAYKRAPSSADVDQMLESDNEHYDLNQVKEERSFRAGAILEGRAEQEEEQPEQPATFTDPEYQGGEGVVTVKRGPEADRGNPTASGGPGPGQRTGGGDGAPAVSVDVLADRAGVATTSEELMEIQDLARSLENVAERNAIAVIIGQRFKAMKGSA